MTGNPPMHDKNRSPVLGTPERRRGEGYAVRFYYFDDAGRRRSGRGYGRTQPEARQVARDRWWEAVRKVRDIRLGRVAPDRPENRCTFADLVAEAVPTLRLIQRPKQVRTTLHYAARFWASCCPSCGHLEDGAYQREDEGVSVDRRSCGASLLGETPIADITTATCNRVLASARGLVADSTLNRVASAGASIFGHAVDARWLDEPPTSGVRRMQEGRRVKPLISGAQALALAKALDERWRPFVLLMLCAGLRLTEARLLRPMDVELDRGVIVVRLGGAGDSPKSGHHREVPIVSTRLARALEEAVERQDPTIARFVDPRKAIERACDAAKIDRVPTRHELRHWFCSAALVSGVAPQTVRGWLGHSTLEVTDGYGHDLAPCAEIGEVLDRVAPFGRLRH